MVHLKTTSGPETIKKFDRKFMLIFKHSVWLFKIFKQSEYLKISVAKILKTYVTF